MNEDSILITIKKLLGIAEEYEHFDMDLIVHINSILSTMYQIGANPKNLMITGEDETWADWLPAGCEYVKTYIFLKTKIVFDPPISSLVMDSYNAQIKELEWRLYSEFNYPLKETE